MLKIGLGVSEEMEHQVLMVWTIQQSPYPFLDGFSARRRARLSQSRKTSNPNSTNGGKDLAMDQCEKTPLKQQLDGQIGIDLGRFERYSVVWGY